MDIWGKITIIDVIVLFALLTCMFIGFRIGLIRSVFKLFRSLLSLIIARQIYPTISEFLQNSQFVKNAISEMVKKSLNMEQAAQLSSVSSLGEQTAFINELKVPGFLTKLLLENNNNVLYKMLDVSSLQEYVVRYIAVLIINALSFMLVFFIVSASLRVLGRFLDVVSKLPVINSFNKLGGILCGVLSGTIFIWFSFTLMTLFYSNPVSEKLISEISNSKIAIWFYKNNLIMDMITKFVG